MRWLLPSRLLHMTDSRGSVQDARARRAFENLTGHDVARALRELEALSGEGYAPAQVLLGWAHEVGRGVPVDTEEALRCYRAAGDVGDPLGQYYAGMLLLRLGQNRSAIAWLEAAAAQKYAPALYRLGGLCEAGLLPDCDASMSDRFMLEAAELGHVYAQRWRALRGLKCGDGWRGFLGGLCWFARAPALLYRLLARDRLDTNLLRR